MTWQAGVFLVLVLNQLAGAVTFIVTYLRKSDWWRSAIGRHLAYWSIAAAALDLTWALLLVLQWPWLVYALFAVQAVFGGLTWQRVALVRRPPRRQTQPGVTDPDTTSNTCSKE